MRDYEEESENNIRSSDIIERHEVPFDVKVVWGYVAAEVGELTMNKGDVVRVDTAGEGWWHGTNTRTNEAGEFPYNYVKKIKEYSSERDFESEGNSSFDGEDFDDFESTASSGTQSGDFVSESENDQDSHSNDFESDNDVEDFGVPIDTWQTQGIDPDEFVEEIALGKAENLDKKYRKVHFGVNNNPNPSDLGSTSGHIKNRRRRRVRDRKYNKKKKLLKMRQRQREQIMASARNLADNDISFDDVESQLTAIFGETLFSKFRKDIIQNIFNGDKGASLSKRGNQSDIARRELLSSALNRPRNTHNVNKRTESRRRNVCFIFFSHSIFFRTKCCT